MVEEQYVSLLLRSMTDKKVNACIQQALTRLSNNALVLAKLYISYKSAEKLTLLIVGDRNILGMRRRVKISKR
ncbi:hypothetical protein CBW53_19610 [Yersinia frederiksenii]|nr:hypothetical protein CBW53_19610 [Yersinia frederiksenii]